jgi:hypothetical protein
LNNDAPFSTQRASDFFIGDNNLNIPRRIPKVDKCNTTVIAPSSNPAS